MEREKYTTKEHIKNKCRAYKNIKWVTTADISTWWTVTNFK